jgi:hypothetical protein
MVIFTIIFGRIAKLPIGQCAVCGFQLQGAAAVAVLSTAFARGGPLDRREWAYDLENLLPAQP